MASSTFDPTTGTWSDGSTDGSAPAGIDGGNPINTNPAQDTLKYLQGQGLIANSSTPATGGPSTGGPVTVGQPAPSNVNPDYWAALQAAQQKINQATNYTPTATNTAAATPSATSSGYPSDLSGWQSYTGNPTDQAAIQAYAQWLAQQPGADPLIASQVGYLAQRISDTGGLTSGNVGYWATRTQAGNWTAPENNSGSTVGQPQGLYGGLTQPSSAMSDSANAAILQLMQSASQPIDAASVAASPEAAAERLGSQRSAEQQIAAAAEKAAQGGTADTGGAEGLTRQILANQGETDATFQGQLASTQRQQQIQQLEFAMQLAVNSGQFDKAQQIESQIAELNASLSSDQTGLGYAQLQEQSNLAAYNAMIQGLY